MIGVCPNCTDNKPKKLIDGLCTIHYYSRLNYRSAKKSIEKNKDVKQALTLWFNEKLEFAPRCCENCDTPLYESAMINPRAIVAHLLPKRANKFPEVATHPDNCAYLCQRCHTKYDSDDIEFIINMPLFPEIKKRILSVAESLDEFQIQRVINFFDRANEKKREVN